MEFELTEEQLMIKTSASDFAQNVLKQGVIERDRDMIHPTAEVAQMGEMGFMGMIITPMLRMIPILPIFFFFLHIMCFL